MTFAEFMSHGIWGIYFRSLGEDKTGSGYFAVTAVIILLCAVIPYFLGSLNFAIIVSKRKYKDDVRNYGSGNAGSTNMLRTYGKRSALLTFGGDVGKAFVSCALGYVLFGLYGAYIAGLFCLLGHIFPVYYKFRGGKGVACMAMIVLMTDLPTFIILLLCFVIIVIPTKYVSLGSVMCMLIYPLILDQVDRWLFKTTGAYVAIALVMALLVIFKHKDNIQRIRLGKESKISFGKNKNNNEKKND